jgi:Asp-tRNA(Asn)/Glu-tRNA(Gln) amidotransferase A subunit family amidase
MPTTTEVAPVLNAPSRLGPSPFCIPFNLSGQPSLSLPSGKDADDMPIGLLLSAASNNDDLLISAATRLELELGRAKFRA